MLTCSFITPCWQHNKPCHFGFRSPHAVLLIDYIKRFHFPLEWGQFQFWLSFCLFETLSIVEISSGCIFYHTSSKGFSVIWFYLTLKFQQNPQRPDRIESRQPLHLFSSQWLFFKNGRCNVIHQWNVRENRLQSILRHCPQLTLDKEQKDILFSLPVSGYNQLPVTLGSTTIHKSSTKNDRRARWKDLMSPLIWWVN